jgi:type I restriction enzyme M protein
MSRDKTTGVNGKRDRSGEILFIDARRVASGRISRTQVEFTDEDLQRIAQIYHRWRETEFSDGGEYRDESGFCYSASLEDVGKHGFMLTPGRYVGAGAQAVDGEPFEEKMPRLVATLREQQSEAARLDIAIGAALEAFGYGE